MKEDASGCRWCRVEKDASVCNMRRWCRVEEDASSRNTESKGEYCDDFPHAVLPGGAFMIMLMLIQAEITFVLDKTPLPLSEKWHGTSRIRKL